MATVEQIIDQALATGAAKSSEADAYSQQAITAAQGLAWVNTQTTSYTPPSTLEPKVNIPQEDTGVDSVLYNNTYRRIIDDISDGFADFLREFFPDECEMLAKTQEWICETLENGGTGINAAVEDQLWQRERSRTLQETKRVSEQAIDAWAARGYPMPPGAAVAQQQEIQLASLRENAQHSRDVAIRSFEAELENVRFAVTTAIQYRQLAVQAAGDYVRALALAPQIASQMATSAANAQAALISAASSYYNARISVERIKTEVAESNANRNVTVGSTNGELFMRSINTRAETAATLATSLGQQAAAALNAVNATAQKVIHESA